MLRLQISLNLRYFGSAYWVILLVTALVTAWVALLLFNPFTVVRVATIIAGVLLLDGGFTLWSVLQS